jgi:hypothetical protein
VSICDNFQVFPVAVLEFFIPLKEVHYKWMFPLSHIGVECLKAVTTVTVIVSFFYDKLQNGCVQWAVMMGRHTGRRISPKVQGKNMAVKNGVFWDITPCDSCKNRRFGGT